MDRSAPAEPDRVSQCGGSWTCYHCDPTGSGEQTVDVAPVPVVIDWTFIEWEPQRA
jgi:hypothetical protein